MEKKDRLPGRYILFLVGLFIASLGVAFSTKAGLGTSPVASIPYSVSLVLPVLSFGTWLNILSASQITAQCILMKGKVNWIEIAIQTVLAFAYGYMTDFSVWILRGIKPDTYPEQFFWMIVGCVVLAFGIWIQFRGGVAMLPGEALNRAISYVTGRKYANIKIFVDMLMIAIAAAICLIFLGGLEGVREGSIIAALGVGSCIKFYERIYSKITKKA